MRHSFLNRCWRFVFSFSIVWRPLFIFLYRGSIWRLYDSYHIAPKVFKKAIWDEYMERHAASISIDAVFKSHPVLPHGVSGIFISKSATIGSNVVIFQQVTIGANTIRDSKTFGAPFIGNDVYIGAGAKIIGGVTVSDNARIGANAVIVKNVAENSLVVVGVNRIYLKENKQVNSFSPYLQ